MNPIIKTVHILFLFTGSLTTIFSSNASAAARHCRNPVTIQFTNQVQMKFCEIPAAQGVAIGDENGLLDDQRPVIRRNFNKFQMGQFEVTQQQFRALTNDRPWIEGGIPQHGVFEGANYPASYIKYSAALRFIERLNALDVSALYRLPTEAEWEYANRAGTRTLYPWGRNFDSDMAYWEGNTLDGKYARQVDTCPSAAKSQSNPGYCANGFGLYHMAGNVWEWVLGSYDSYAYATSNGHIPIETGTTLRAVRGGAWFNNWGLPLQSAMRWGSLPEADRYSHGFRVVRFPK